MTGSDGVEQVAGGGIANQSLHITKRYSSPSPSSSRDTEQTTELESPVNTRRMRSVACKQYERLCESSNSSPKTKKDTIWPQYFFHSLQWTAPTRAISYLMSGHRPAYPRRSWPGQIKVTFRTDLTASTGGRLVMVKTNDVTSDGTPILK